MAWQNVVCAAQAHAKAAAVCTVWRADGAAPFTACVTAEARFLLHSLSSWRPRRDAEESLGETLLRRQVASSCHRAELAMGRAQQELAAVKEQLQCAVAPAAAAPERPGKGLSLGGEAETPTPVQLLVQQRQELQEPQEHAPLARRDWGAAATSEEKPQHLAFREHAQERSSPLLRAPPTPRLHMTTPPQQRVSAPAHAVREPARRPPHLATPPTPPTPQSDADEPSEPVWSVPDAPRGADSQASAEPQRRPAPLALPTMTGNRPNDEGNDEAGGGFLLEHEGSPPNILTDAAGGGGGGEARGSSERVLREIESLLFSRRGRVFDLAFGTSPGSTIDGPPTPDLRLPLPLSPDAGEDAAGTAGSSGGGVSGGEPAREVMSPPVLARGSAPDPSADPSAQDASVGHRGHRAGYGAGDGPPRSPYRRRADMADAAVQLSGSFASVAVLVAGEPPFLAADAAAVTAAAAAAAASSPPRERPASAFKGFGTASPAGSPPKSPERHLIHRYDMAAPPPLPLSPPPLSDARSQRAGEVFAGVKPAHPLGADAAISRTHASAGADLPKSQPPIRMAFRNFDAAAAASPGNAGPVRCATAPANNRAGLAIGSPVFFSLTPPQQLPAAPEEAPSSLSHLFPEHNHEHNHNQQRAATRAQSADSALPVGYYGVVPRTRQYQAGMFVPYNRRPEENGHSEHEGAVSVGGAPASPTGVSGGASATAASASAAGSAHSGQNRRAALLAAAGLSQRDWEALSTRSEELRRGLGTVVEVTEPPPPAPASELSGAMPVRRLAYDDAREARGRPPQELAF